MSDVLEYKGYSGTVEYSLADNVLFGKVLGIKGLISYEGDSVQNLRKDFEGAVDEYLEMCAENNEEPQKPYRGSFNVRVSPELHRSLAIYSFSRGQTLNSTVEEAIKRHVQAL
jgi:predicted HicB family RNase H-like nuclease